MRRGEITVFLSLVLMLLLSFMGAVIEAARVNTVRFQIECAMDMAMYSALAEYHRELLYRYDLFYIDTSYGQEGGNPANTAQHLFDFLSYNVEPHKGLKLYEGRDLLGLGVQDVAILEVDNATDNNCESMKRQAVSYMKDKIGLRFVEEQLAGKELVQEKDMMEGIEKLRQDNQEKIASFDGRKIKTGDDEWKEVEVENPVEEIPVQDSGFVYRVTKDSAGISGKRIEQQNYVSHRELRGACQRTAWESADSMPAEVLFDEYLLEHCGSYTNPLEKSLLSYQIEYILAGKDSDSANLEEVLKKLLLLRETANYAYILTDSSKTAQARSIAAGISAVALVPELKPVLEQAILLAWSYVESVNDIKILLEKGRVPLRKNKADWNMGFGDMLLYPGSLSGAGENAAEKAGLSYTDYLRVLLLLQNGRNKTVRFADIVEMDIRKTPGNQRFQLDVCIDRMDAQATVAGSFGCRYDIRRQYGYALLE